MAIKYKKAKPELYQRELQKLAQRHRQYRKTFDMKIVGHMDQKVNEQQVMMEKAGMMNYPYPGSAVLLPLNSSLVLDNKYWSFLSEGVPGFCVTTNPAEIKVQMLLMDFILRLSVMDIPHVAFDD